MKDDIRNKFKKIRNSLKSTDILEKSKNILNNLIDLPYWVNSQKIMCYLSIGSEVKTFPIIKKAWEENKKVAVPVCFPNFIIKPSLITSFEDLEPKTLGILEPKKNKRKFILPASIDLCLIPGIAFDIYGHRVGYGAGYYDRFLPLLKPETPKVALAFEAQVSNIPLPTDKFDISMDYIITEKRIIKLKNN